MHLQVMKTLPINTSSSEKGRDRTMDVAEQQGLSATNVGSAYACDTYWDDPSLSPEAGVCMRAGRILQISEAFGKLYPADCRNPTEMGAFTNARRAIITDATWREMDSGEVRNLVFLAEGVSPSAYFMAKSLATTRRDCRVIASDLRDAVSLQRYLIQELVAEDLANGWEIDLDLHCRNVDVTNPRDIAKLVKMLRERLGRTVIVCEGLLGYLSKKTLVDRVMPHVRSLLQLNRQNVLLCDIASRQGLTRTIFTGSSKTLLDAFYKKAGIKPENLAFDSGQDFANFCQENGVDCERLTLGNPEKFPIPRYAKASEQQLRQVIRQATCYALRLSDQNH